MLAVFTALLFCAEPGSLGELQNVDGYRVTLLAVRELSANDLISRDGRPAPGGRRVWWLVEPPEGSSEPPRVGDVRLSINGKAYNEVTSPSSNKANAPDVVVRDYDDAAGLVPAPKLPPRPGAVVAEVILRGKALKAGATGVAELQVLGKRAIWCRSRTW